MHLSVFYQCWSGLTLYYVLVIHVLVNMDNYVVN